VGYLACPRIDTQLVRNHGFTSAPNKLLWARIYSSKPMPARESQFWNLLHGGQRCCCPLQTPLFSQPWLQYMYIRLSNWWVNQLQTKSSSAVVPTWEKSGDGMSCKAAIFSLFSRVQSIYAWHIIKVLPITWCKRSALIGPFKKSK
jgi:hypothetical protein